MGKHKKPRTKGKTKARPAQHIESKLDVSKPDSTPETPVHQTSKLFSLPPEIRDRIYRLVLTTTSDVEFQPSDCFPISLGSPKLKLNPVLEFLLVSRQIYLEAFHIYYGANTFAFGDTDVLGIFLTRIGYARRQQIRKIAFCWRGKAQKQTFRILKTCSNLKTVKLTLPHFQPAGYVALREVRGLEFVEIDCDAEDPWLLALPENNFLQDPLSDHVELRRAMMRPRLKSYANNPDEKIDLFKGRREIWRKTEEQMLDKIENPRLESFSLPIWRPL